MNIKDLLKIFADLDLITEKVIRGKIVIHQVGIEAIPINYYNFENSLYLRVIYNELFGRNILFLRFEDYDGIPQMISVIAKVLFKEYELYITEEYSEGHGDFEAYKAEKMAWAHSILDQYV